MCKCECCVCNDCCGKNSKTIHAQLSSSVDQPNGPLGTGVPITFNIQDSIHGVGHLPGSSEVHISEDGLYFVLAAPQTGATCDCGFTSDYWMKVNGDNVANSNVRFVASNSESKDVIVTQGVLKLKDGDVLQIFGAGLTSKCEAITQMGEPLVPSIIFTMYKV